uniref:uncharacterized protein LOC120339477 n=1 Tax=Styela clava TaxID=7725 RepID=UPI0019392D0A|nr:uncharacterized protein LOC120339477 [Styela clava]
MTDAITQEEKDLADSLQAVCTPYGDERITKLKECSDILYKMGKLYMDKTETSTGMTQKMDFIKSATLLHGARVRYEIISDTEGIENLQPVLKLLDARLLAASNAANQDISVDNLSKNIYRGFKLFRGLERNSIETLELIEEDLTESEIHRKQKERIQSIHKLMKNTTSHFKHLMQYIARNCIDILGDPPCAFAIVGLGSLTREEITLYSDFEHVIVLEEGVQQSTEYERVQEYFRWFAVIFQVVMTGLGETIIRSVGVKSINDLYSEDKSKNWYYDMFTTSGVCFDGMVPHSCNTPLGRQEPTKKRQHKVELIQPASKMASYLTTEEHIKNGYYLKDILTRTCFVYGDKKVYNNFRYLVGNVIGEEMDRKRYKEVFDEIEKNVNVGVTGTTWVLHESVKFDVKTSFYRPLTALIAYAARIYKISSNSSFDILSKLDFMFEGDFHETQYALATACELRLKVYAEGGCRRYKVTPNDLYKFISKKCAVNCLQHTHKFAEVMRAYIMKHLGIKSNRTIEPGPGISSGITPALMFLSEYDDALISLEKELTDMSNFKTEKLEIWRIHSVLMENSRLGISPSEEWLETTEKRLLDIIEHSEDNLKITNACGLLSNIYEDQDRRSELIKIHKIWFERSMADKEIASWYFDFGGSMLMIRTDEAVSMEQVMAPEEMLELCKEELLKYDDIYSNLAFRLGVAIAQLNMDMLECGAQGLRDVLNDSIERGCKKIGKPMLIEFSETILCTQVGQDLFEDGYYTLKATDIIQESQMGIVGKITAKDGMDLMKMICLLKVADKETDASTRSDLINRALEICRNPQDDKLNNFRYNSAIYLLLKIDIRRMEEFDVDLFIQVFSESPNEVQNDGRLKFVIMTTFSSLLRRYLDKMIAGEILKYSSRLWKIVNIFRHHFTHAHILGLLRDLTESYVIRKSLSKLMIQTNKQNLWESMKVESNSFISMPALSSEMETFDFSKSVNYFWKLLHADLRNGDVKNYNVRYLIDLLYGNICVRVNNCLRTFVSKAIQSHSGNVLSNVSSTFSTGIHAFYKSRYTSAAKSFWKVINSQNTTRMLKLRSMVMLNHTVIFKMDNGYTVPNFWEGYIALDNKMEMEDPTSAIPSFSLT